MKLRKELKYIFYRSYLLISKNFLLWFFFYSFALFGLLMSNTSIYLRDKIPFLIFTLSTIGLSALKVEFLDSIDKNKLPQFKKTLKLLFYYFKKLIGLVIFLILLFISSFALFNFIVSNILNNSSPSIIMKVSNGINLGMILFNLSKFISYLLSVVYFSLFHLFFVILVLSKKGIISSLKNSVYFLKKHLLISIIIISASLVIHYPFSDFIVKIVNLIPFDFNHLLIKSFLTFFNVVMDLFFFAVWMVFYKKKS